MESDPILYIVEAFLRRHLAESSSQPNQPLLEAVRLPLQLFKETLYVPSVRGGMVAGDGRE